MATSTIPLDGKTYLVEYSTNLTTPAYVPLGYQNSANLSIRTETRQITSKDTCKYREKVPTVTDWSISGEAQFYHGTAGASNLKALQDAQLAHSKVLVRLTPVDCGDDVVGELQYAGKAVIAEISASFPTNDTATYSYTFEGDGALTITVTT